MRIRHSTNCLYKKDLGLHEDKNIPMIGIVSRLVQQKGLDLIACVLNDILQLNVQLVVLGTGDHEYENLIKHAAWSNPGICQYIL